MACSLKLSSRNADCSLERRSFLRADPPSSSSLAREHARSAPPPGATWPCAEKSVGNEPALSLLGDDDAAAAAAAPASSCSSSSCAAAAPAPATDSDGARFTSKPRVDDASK